MLPEELAEATKIPVKRVTAALKTLAKEYVESDSSLEVAPAGKKWAMQLKTRYAERARKLARMEVPAKVLKTLALIAFHQPIKQSELKDMVGSVVYDHVHDLHERGMVTARQEGVTKILKTTDSFLEYFGVDAQDRDGIRTLLAKRVGIDPSKLKPAERQSQQTLEEEASKDEKNSPEAEEDGTASAQDAGSEEPIGDGSDSDEDDEAAQPVPSSQAL
jgi:segregation and condensation protein B